MKTVFFSASQFVPTQWDTAKDKARFANHFLDFVENGFEESKFPKWFYKRLSMTFGHIAHFDQGGFFAEFFTTTKDKLRFLRQCIQHPCFGDPAHTYSDVEQAIVQRVCARGYFQGLEIALAREVEAQERAELARLKSKYEGAKPCP